MNIIKITEYGIKLSSTAVLADLFYIIARLTAPVETAEDASFICAVPEMLELMLLSAAVIAIFGTAMCRLPYGSDRHDR